MLCFLFQLRDFRSPLTTIFCCFLASTKIQISMPIYKLCTCTQHNLPIVSFSCTLFVCKHWLYGTLRDYKPIASYIVTENLDSHHAIHYAVYLFYLHLFFSFFSKFCLQFYIFSKFYQHVSLGEQGESALDIGSIV